MIDSGGGGRGGTGGGSGGNGSDGENRWPKISTSLSTRTPASSPDQTTRYSLFALLYATAGSKALKLVLPSGPRSERRKSLAPTCTPAASIRWAKHSFS